MTVESTRAKVISLWKSLEGKKLPGFAAPTSCAEDVHMLEAHFPPGVLTEVLQELEAFEDPSDVFKSVNRTHQGIAVDKTVIFKYCSSNQELFKLYLRARESEAYKERQASKGLQPFSKEAEVQSTNAELIETPTKPDV